MKKVFGIIAIIAVLNFYPMASYAFEKDTHKAINEYIAQNSINGFSLDQYLTNQLGFQKGVTEKFSFGEVKPVFNWIGDGGKTEDITWLRSCNHFHDPISNTGFSGIFMGILCNGDSSIIWAQKPKSTQDPGGYYSWFDARDFFYKSLTSTTKTDRDKYFAETFRGVGQLMHLVQDISVPAHVRNQAHIGYHYEGFVLKYQNGKVPIPAVAEVAFNSLLANPYPLQSSIFNEAIYDESAPVPISALWDQNKYTGGDWYPGANDIVGLAEYTNANFFSDFTIFQGYTHPKKANTNAALREMQAEDGQIDRPYYIQGYESDFLAAYSYFRNLDLSGVPEGWKYNLDDRVYSDYAQKLIPRAVGYSAGLLDYFFRGRIEAVNPVFSSTGATLKVKNNTPNEAIEMPGKFVVSYEYKTSGGDIIVGVSSNEVQLAERIPAGAESPTEYSFTFTPPIPSDAQNPKYWLVFRGKLGNEDDAVVGKKIGNEFFPAYEVDGGWIIADWKTLEPLYYVDETEVIEAQQAPGIVIIAEFAFGDPDPGGTFLPDWAYHPPLPWGNYSLDANRTFTSKDLLGNVYGVCEETDHVESVSDYYSGVFTTNGDLCDGILFPAIGNPTSPETVLNFTFLKTTYNCYRTFSGHGNDFVDNLDCEIAFSTVLNGVTIDELAPTAWAQWNPADGNFFTVSKLAKQQYDSNGNKRYEDEYLYAVPRIAFISSIAAYFSDPVYSHDTRYLMVQGGETLTSVLKKIFEGHHGPTGSGPHLSLVYFEKHEVQGGGGGE